MLKLSFFPFFQVTMVDTLTHPTCKILLVATTGGFTHACKEKTTLNEYYTVRISS